MLNVSNLSGFEELFNALERSIPHENHLAVIVTVHNNRSLKTPELPAEIPGAEQHPNQRGKKNVCFIHKKVNRNLKMLPGSKYKNPGWINNIV